ncbi:MAG: PD-(D/E)XK nuclease family protein [Bdellovibrionales bacterium]|nr:PD-(D/E)XK nuclease family protein [Bdellovibrionales bacterium]
MGFTWQPHPRPAQADELEGFDIENTTWVVPTLAAKFEIQKILLKRHSLLPEDAVLRAAELWQKMATRVCPEWRLVSPGLTQILASEWLKQQDFSWAKLPGASSTLIRYAQQMLPIFSQPGTQELVEEWLGNPENGASLMRWGRWYFLAKQWWGDLNRHGLVPQKWLPGLLGAREEVRYSWSRNIVVDLGADLSLPEVHLFQQLGEQNQVTVFVPTPSWRSRYVKTLFAYESFVDIQTKSEDATKLESAFKENPDLQLERYTTQLAEVKAAVHFVREYLDQGVPASKLAILAPQIEHYWPVLSSYLDQEGIPVNKDQVTSLQTFPEVGFWLSELRLSSGRLSSVDLERALYNVDSHFELDFEKFRSLFAVIYDDEDLLRSPELSKMFVSEVKKDQPLTRDEFLVWAIKHWRPHWSAVVLEKLVSRWIAETFSETTLLLDSWIKYLEEVSARGEIKLRDPDYHGIHCLNLEGAEWLDVSHVFFLDLAEDSLKTQLGTGITHGDLSRLDRDLGVQLSPPENASLEFTLAWLLQRPFKKVQLSVAASDFEGAVKLPSLLWLLGAIEKGLDPEAVKVPSMTRWDDIQRTSIDQLQELRQWPAERFELMSASMAVDLGEKPLDEFQPAELTLSATQLEKYQKCPFVFAAEKLFHLSDLPNVDLDVDAMTRGQLTHKLFEALTAEPMRFDWSETELLDVIDRCRQAVRVKMADPRLWAGLQTQYLELAKKFLLFEGEYRRQFPQARTVGRELKVNAKWSEDLGQLVSESGDGIPFRGAIDRVDTDGQGHYAVIDYKSSGNGLTNHGSWLKNDRFQLPLYGQAVRDGLTELPEGDVVAALYHNVKDMERKAGFKVENKASTLYEIKSTEKITEEKMNHLFQNTNEVISGIVQKMQSGKFAPNPKDPAQLCGDCRWRIVCRASHLN